MPHDSPPHNDISVLIEQSLAYHRAGRLDEAHAICQRALACHPNHPAALHRLGAIALDRGELESAAGLIDHALSQVPENASYLSDRGVVAARLGNHAGAAVFQRRAIAAEPGYANAHNNLGNSLIELGDISGAVQHYRRARELAPQSAQFAFNLGGALEAAGDNGTALAQLREAGSLAPDNTTILTRLGSLLRAMGHHEEAAACFASIVVREPPNVHSLFGLAHALSGMHRYHEAISLYRRAAELQPDAAEIVNNLAFAYTALARYDEAEVWYRRALELNPGLPESKFQLGMLLLRRGDYAGGWPLFENRKFTEKCRPNYRKLPVREWQGEPLGGKRFLIAREQGAGDEIQFLRYANVLADLGAQVGVWVAPELAQICASVRGVTCVLDALPEDAVVAKRYDFWCHVMSLPSRLPDVLVPADVPYMRANPSRVDAWRMRLDALADDAPRRIGLVWAGNPWHLFDVFRSVPLTELLPLAACGGNAWFAIQKGPGRAQLPDVAGRWPLHAVGSDLCDFADTAALIESLDLVITVDTSVAHLAGALGKPVWVLLSAQPDWRWGMGSAESVWYPSARLFRQTTLGDWGGVVAEVAEALRRERSASCNRDGF